MLFAVLLSAADTPTETKPIQVATSSNATIEVLQNLNATENASVEVDSSPVKSGDDLPLVFPEKASNNETAVQILLNKTSSAIDSEVN